MKLLMILAAFLMMWASVCLANPAESKVAVAADGEVHDMVGDEHFLKKYYKHRAYYPAPIYRPVYHPVPVYHPIPVYHKKYHKG
ncbi:uncharacterized protein LOC116929001 [Daphnia magna]|uniref:Uncharacterized protein n=2 Tax=Daphnia magna TaxID=35525 RepID=A0A0N8CE98_9CRUS|nr:uncharacterized protein LOC116929001 [Daphnia magna]KAK4035950.1 hypothetical protein OUZ56_028028 [Daphnia magna]KZS12837.1 Uncharacterized protein APZ42_022065 [Daphnia magna]